MKSSIRSLWIHHCVLLIQVKTFQSVVLKRKTRKSRIEAALIFRMTNEHLMPTYPNLLTIKMDLFLFHINWRGTSNVLLSYSDHFLTDGPEPVLPLSPTGSSFTLHDAPYTFLLFATYYSLPFHNGCWGWINGNNI